MSEDEKYRTLSKKGLHERPQGIYGFVTPFEATDPKIREYVSTRNLQLILNRVVSSKVGYSSNTVY